MAFASRRSPSLGARRRLFARCRKELGVGKGSQVAWEVVGQVRKVPIFCQAV